MAADFRLLLSALDVGPVRVRNRIVSSGHATRLADGQIAGERFIAYHRARAAGGVGLIITEASMITPDSVYSNAQLVNTDDSVIPSLANLTEAVHAEGAKIFGQLLHLGLDQPRSVDGLRVAAWGPSAGSAERYHTSGRALSRQGIAEIVEAFAAGAARYRSAGYDGVEIAASHGYLIAQFLSASVNRRTDDYGGSFEKRLRFLREILDAVRDRIGDAMALGVRISADEMTDDGLEPDDVVAVAEALGVDGVLDYFNIAIGSSRQIGAAVHIVSPMGTDMAISTPVAARVKDVVPQPVLAVGRINHPRQAEEILTAGHADLCGMTRALITDPDMPAKIGAGRLDDVRICVACDQACIDRFHRGHGISCIQHPETGRELVYGRRIAAEPSRRVLVVGGGPAGMKAAAVAAERGHEVTLFEAADHLGGQVRLAERLPRRSELGGVIPNLERELELAGVEVKTGVRVDRDLVARLAPDAVVIATGAEPRRTIGEVDAAHIVDAWTFVQGEAEVGRRVLVVDTLCDWTGIGVAEQLALDRHRVTLASTGHVAGETIPRYVRDQALGDLHRLGVTLIPLVRFYGADEDTVYLQHMASGLPVIVDDIDTVVLSAGCVAVDTLERRLADLECEVHVIGDACAPRTIEEAVLEGLQVGSAL